MPVEDVLDDRKTESGALLLARGVGIDAIEPLGQPGDMLGGDACAVIGHRKSVVEPGASGDRLEGDLDLAAGAIERSQKHTSRQRVNLSQ